MTSELRNAAKAVVAAKHHMQWNLPTGATEVYLVPIKDRDALARALAAPSPSIDERAQRAAEKICKWQRDGIPQRMPNEIIPHIAMLIRGEFASEFRDLEGESVADEEVIEERDRFEREVSEIHRALGGDGEFVTKVPPQEPPHSGDPFLDSLAIIDQKLAIVAEARELLNRAKTFVVLDVQMVADFTRFAPLSPEDQHRHDTTESESEKLLPLIDEFLNRTVGK